MGMRRTVLLMLVSMASALLLACGVALAATIGCDGGLCVGTAKSDTMSGAKQKDDMLGRAGDDSLVARANNDTLKGGPGADKLSGDGGNDRYVFDDEWGYGERITADGENGGVDTLDFSPTAEGVVVRLYNYIYAGDPYPDAYQCPCRTGFTATLRLPKTVRVENAYGGAGNDSLFGNDANNRLGGNGGGDDMSGGRGADTMSGGPGQDESWPGPGDDILRGGDGSDDFGFEDGWGHDTLADPAGATHLSFRTVRRASVHVDLEGITGSNVIASSSDSSLGQTNTLTASSSMVISRVTGGARGDEIRGDDHGNHLYGDEIGDEIGIEDNKTDTLDGRAGNDMLLGWSGGDTLYGGPGTDTVYGDDSNPLYDWPKFAGNDTIDVSDDDAGDSVDCGPGTDTVYVDTEVADGQVDDAIDSHVNCETVLEGDAPSSP
jgi:Ca2+-binding RTX toxin-like protein